MQSFVKPQLICGVFLLFAVIVRAEENLTQEVTIEQITEPTLQYKSPFWDDDSGKLYISDSFNNKVVRLNPATGELTYAFLSNVSINRGLLGPVIPVEGESSQFVAGFGQYFVRFAWDSDKNSDDTEFEILGMVDPDLIGNEFNEGKCDSHGRFWAGTRGALNFSSHLHVNPDEGSLYLLTSDLDIRTKITPVTISEGVAWNRANTIFYYVDTATYQVVAYNYSAEHGLIAQKKIIFDFPSHNISGTVHGITVDTDDNLWVVVYKSGYICNIDPVQGEILRKIKMPSSMITSVTFGGDSLDILYVSSRSVGFPAEMMTNFTGSGSVFAIKGLGVQGYKANKFILNRKN